MTVDHTDMMLRGELLARDRATLREAAWREWHTDLVASLRRIEEHAEAERRANETAELMACLGLVALVASAAAVLVTVGVLYGAFVAEVTALAMLAPFTIYAFGGLLWAIVADIRRQQ
jgi:hypothetical protein